MLMLLPVEIMQLMFAHLVKTHVVALCRCRCACRWLERCANVWTRATLTKLWNEGDLKWRFQLPSQPCGWPRYVFSEPIMAGQSSTGPLWWRLVFFPRGNNASGWMSLYVQPQTIPIRNTRVQMAFASDCGTFMTSIKFCLEKQSDWGYRTWRKFPTDVVEHIDVAVSVVMMELRC